jgi:hypothetical protein
MERVEEFCDERVLACGKEAMFGKDRIGGLASKAQQTH